MRVVLAADNRHLPVVVVRCRGRKLRVKGKNIVLEVVRARND
jgi:hypothetical protein